MATVFWDKEGVLLVDYLQKGSTINAKYDCALLTKLRQNIKEKRWGNLSKRCHPIAWRRLVTHCRWNNGKTNLLRLSSDAPIHPIHPSPSDYHLFPNLKKHLKRDNDLGVFRRQLMLQMSGYPSSRKNFICKGLKRLQDRCRKCTDFLGGICRIVWQLQLS